MNRAVSNLYPPFQRDALVAASQLESRFERVAAINAITEELVRLGLCRPRHDDQPRPAALGGDDSRGVGAAAHTGR